MSGWRTHRWGSGRLIRTSLIGFWQAPKSLDAADPEIPNLPIVTPAAPPAVTEIASFFRPLALPRRGITRTRIRLEAQFVVEAAAAPETISNVGGAPFATRQSRSRKRILPLLPASFTPASQPAVFPVAALGGAVVRRRRDTTNRRQIELGDITSALVAPLIGALPRPKANVVWFERTIRLPQPLAIYPPPTGPPQPVFDAPTAHRRVSQRRRLFLPEQADFAAASVPPSDAQVSGEPFRTVKSRSRKRQPDLPAPFFTVSTPPATVTLPAPTVKRRHDGERRLQHGLLAEFAATPPGTSPVTIAALAARKVHKRRQRHGLLLSGGAGIFDSPAVTYAVTPAALHKQGQFKRRDTERRLQRVTPLAEFTVAAYTPSDALVTGEPFSTRLSRSRRMVRQPIAASFEAAPPVTAPVVALPIPKANRRRPRRGVLLTGGDGVFQPPYIVLPAPKAFRVEHRRKLVRLPVLAAYTFAAPPTFPVVALPAPKAFRTHGLMRTLLLAPVWFDVPATPATADGGNSGGWWPEYHYVRRVRDVRLQRQRKVEAEQREIQDATDREIARLLAEQEAREAEAADLARLQALADKYAGQKLNLPKPARVAILNAYDARTRNALEQMLRVLDQLELEEHLALIAALLLDDE